MTNSQTRTTAHTVAVANAPEGAVALAESLLNGEIPEFRLTEAKLVLLSWGVDVPLMLRHFGYLTARG